MLALYQSPRSRASFARSNMIHSQIQNPSPTLPLWKQNSANSSNDPSIPVCQPVLPDQVLPQKIHFVMRGCRQQHLKAKAFLFLRGNKEGTCFVCFPCFEWPDFSEVKRGKIKVLLEFGWGKRNLSTGKMCTPWVNMHDVLCSCLGTKIIILKQIWVVKACLWERWASFASKIRKSSRPPTARSRSLKQHLSNYTCLRYDVAILKPLPHPGWRNLRLTNGSSSGRSPSHRAPHIFSTYSWGVRRSWRSAEESSWPQSLDNGKGLQTEEYLLHLQIDEMYWNDLKCHQLWKRSNVIQYFLEVSRITCDQSISLRGLMVSKLLHKLRAYGVSTWPLDHGCVEITSFQTVSDFQHIVCRASLIGNIGLSLADSQHFWV